MIDSPKPDIPPSLEFFSAAFMANSALTVLDLSDNALSPAGATAIKPLLASCLTLQVRAFCFALPARVTAPSRSDAVRCGAVQG